MERTPFRVRLPDKSLVTVTVRPDDAYGAYGRGDYEVSCYVMGVMLVRGAYTPGSKGIFNATTGSDGILAPIEKALNRLHKAGKLPKSVRQMVAERMAK